MSRQTGGLGRALGTATVRFDFVYASRRSINIPYTEQRDAYFNGIRRKVDSLVTRHGDMREALEFIATAPESRDWPLNVYAPLAKCI